MEYIRTARSLGAKDDHIHAQLTAAGWYTVDVQDALHLYQKLDIHLASVQERVLATKASGRKPEIEPSRTTHALSIVVLLLSLCFAGYVLVLW
jgi:hypothetical protein